MTWNVKNNNEPSTKTIANSGMCSRFNVKANVVSFFSGRIICKTDLQKTYFYQGAECSLLEQTKEANFSPCMDSCPLIIKQFP